MESNGMPGRMFGNLGSSVGMIGLEPSLQQPSSQQNPPNHRQQTHPPPSAQQTTNTQMMGFSTGYNTTPTADQPPQTHLSMKQNYQNHPFFAAPHQQQPKSAASDEDEHGSANDGDPFDEKRKLVSPWQRMKWTDTMVKLLIMAVYYIGDEAGGGSSSEQPSAGDKKSKSGGSGTAAAQKKGKWKSVSWAMMEKGYSVSPQQCEDKFNDLNKRYKRVNDILGKGTACKVVENQGLLDGMDLSPKRKEEVRKLLNSKHLYFREMCAYHNSCGHGSGAHQSSESAVEQQQQLQNQLCNSHPMMMTPPSSMNMRGNFAEESMFVKGGELDIDEDEDEDENEDDDEEEYDHDHHGHVSGQDSSRKRGREESSGGGIAAAAAAGFMSGGGGGSGSPSPPLMCTQLSGEIMGVLGDGNKTAWDKKHWMMVKLLQVEEQGVKYQYEAFEIEKQRLKWVRFSSKKEREMEKMKIDNERRRLENQRMLLLLRQKELEMLNHQRPSPPSNLSPMSN